MGLNKISLKKIIKKQLPMPPNFNLITTLPSHSNFQLIYNPITTSLFLSLFLVKILEVFMKNLFCKALFLELAEEWSLSPVAPPSSPCRRRPNLHVHVAVWPLPVSPSFSPSIPGELGRDDMTSDLSPPSPWRVTEERPHNY